jgi:hypothetical protein
MKKMPNPNEDAPVVDTAPAAPAEPESAPVDSGATLDIDDIASMLSFDPFAESDAPADLPAETPQDGSVPSADAGASGSEVPATPVEQAAPEPVQESPEMVLLRQQMAQQQLLIDRLSAAPVAPSATPGQSTAADPLAEFIPSYNFQIPPQLSAMLDSEDSAERTQGIQYLLDGSLRKVHRNVLEQVQGMLTSYVPQQLQQHTQNLERGQAIKTDFYSAHKDLDTPDIRKLVSMITPQVMVETQQTTWSPLLRDAIATKVKGMLGFRPQALAAVPIPQAAAPLQFDQGSRGPVQTGNSVQNDVMNTLF